MISKDSSIRALLFDLGGVLYRIDHALTRAAFGRLEYTPEFSLSAQHPLFDDYDCGRIETLAFLEQLRSIFGIHGTDAELTAAWNAMLLGIISANVGLVATLHGQLPMYLLSNINDLHYRAIETECAVLFGKFDRIFLSYEMGLRKPSPAIYQRVLHETGHSPAELLFIDDAPQNIAAASDLGISTLHCSHPEMLPEELAKRLTLK